MLKPRRGHLNRHRFPYSGPYYNRPSLRIRRGRAVFHPASGMCPMQTERWCESALLCSFYGKFGVRSTGAEVEPIDVSERLLEQIGEAGSSRYNLRDMAKLFGPIDNKIVYVDTDGNTEIEIVYVDTDGNTEIENNVVADEVLLLPKLYRYSKEGAAK